MKSQLSKENLLQKIKERLDCSAKLGQRLDARGFERVYRKTKNRCSRENCDLRFSRWAINRHCDSFASLLASVKYAIENGIHYLLFDIVFRRCGFIR